MAFLHNVRSVAILGLGLMGGSLGLACRRKARGLHVSAYARRAETRRDALAQGIVDVVSDDPCEAVQGADLTVLCTPILDMPALVAQIKPHLQPGSLVTDVGSTKAMLEQDIGSILKDADATFCGSHPMAGSEQTGLVAARADLYDDAVVIVTQPEDAPAAVPERVAAFWRALGAKVLVMDAARHDAVVAGTSHVPHLLAALLVRAAARVTPDPAPFCGPGFRDATRIAGGSEFVWHDIVKSNAAPICDVLHAVRADLDQLLALLEDQQFAKVRDWLAAARQNRVAMLPEENNQRAKEVT